jgi:hypothetical protein
VPRRELRSVRTGQPLGGSVVLGRTGTHRFEGGGGRYLARLIEQLGGEAAAARDVFENGASNGYWYFHPVPPVEALP